jgi:anti-sigma factor RsiW
MSHPRAFELLPWLANGSLAAEEREAVEQHVRSCLSCHRELKEQQRLRVAVRSQPAVHISEQTGFEKLTRMLAGEGVVAERRAPPFNGFLRYAFVGAGGVGLLAVLFWLAASPPGGSHDPSYSTLATDTPQNGQLDIVFARSVTASDMQALLEEIGGSIAAGPSDAGRYTIRLDDSRRGAADLDALIERLGKDPRIRFAGRAAGAELGP